MEYFKQNRGKEVVKENALELKFKIISLIKSHKCFCEEKALPFALSPLTAKKWNLERTVKYFLNHFLWERDLKEFLVEPKTPSILNAEATYAAKGAISLTPQTLQIKNIVVITPTDESDKFRLRIVSTQIENDRPGAIGVDMDVYSQCGEYLKFHVLDNGDIKFYNWKNPPEEEKTFDLNLYLPDLMESINEVRSQPLDETEEKEEKEETEEKIEDLQTKKMQ